MLLVLIAAPSASAVLHVGQKSDQQACEAADLKRRAQFQNKLAGLCEEMCKEVGQYPNCAQCAGFIPPDPTPGVMTWEELLEHMDNLSDWGHDELKAWRKQASALQKQASFLQMFSVKHIQQKGEDKNCEASDLKRRAQVQNKLAGLCEEMCKEVGQYPNCAQCAGFVPPDSTPGVMTWEELLEHMDNLSDWGHDELKAWRKQASALQKQASFLQMSAVRHIQQKGEDKNCEASDLKRRAQVQNKLAGLCEEMCKEVGQYPNCAQCAGFVPPDSTPGVMTWEELLEHMDNLSDWGHDELKAWRKQASALQK